MILQRLQGISLLALVATALVAGCGGHGVIPSAGVGQAGSNLAPSQSGASGVHELRLYIMDMGKAGAKIGQLYNGPDCHGNGYPPYPGAPVEIYPGGTLVGKPLPTPPVHNSTWVLQTPKPLPAGWTQTVATPPPSDPNQYTFTWTVPANAVVGSQLCVVNTYSYQNGGDFTAWFPVLFTIIDPSLEIFDLNQQRRVQEAVESHINVLGGGQINLQAKSIDGSTVSNTVWTLNGNPIKDYQFTNAQATPVPLVATDKTQNPIAFYWTLPGNHSIGLTATTTKNGVRTIHNLTGLYQVRLEAPDQMSAVTNGVKLGQYISGDPQTQLSLGTQLSLPNSAGIVYTYVDFPADNVFLALHHQIQSKTDVVADPKASSPPPPIPNTGGQWWADGCALLTIGWINGSLQNQNIYFPVGFASFSTFDAPAQPLSPSALSYTVTDSFRDYYMYKLAPGQVGPDYYPKTIWVPLARMDWSYKGTATKSGGVWTLSSKTDPPSTLWATPITTELLTWPNTLYPLGDDCPPIP